MKGFSLEKETRERGISQIGKKKVLPAYTGACVTIF